ncbi:Protein arg-6, mitochondrial, partial [Coniosporium uncinatum]
MHCALRTPTARVVARTTRRLTPSTTLTPRALLPQPSSSPQTQLTSRRQYASLDSQQDAWRTGIHTVLSNISTKREIEQYLNYFSSVPPSQFAVLKVGGAVLTEHLDALCGALRVVVGRGLYPIIVHGAGPQMNKILEDAGVEPQYEEGIRITDAKTLRIARGLFLEENA